MSVARYVLLGALVCGLLATTAGWYLTAHEGSEEAFESCRIEEGYLVLGFAYGANYAVRPSMDIRGRDVVVALNVERGDGPAPAILLHGEARFMLLGGSDTIRYADGKVLDCSQQPAGTRSSSTRVSG